MSAQAEHPGSHFVAAIPGYNEKRTVVGAIRNLKAKG